MIREAFAGVAREGGVSWSESYVIDGHGTEQEQLDARLLDKDQSWEELVDDPGWDCGVAAWPFFDPIGFRYYVAAAMVRGSREGGDEFLGYALEMTSRFREEKISLFTTSQLQATARFVRFMIAVYSAQNDFIYGESWQFAYKVFWRQHDVGTPLG